MTHVIAQVTVVPLGTGSTSLSKYVAEVEKVIDKYPDVKRMLTPMSTILEGDLDRILAIIREMHETPFSKGAKRVSTRVTIDDRRDKIVRAGAGLSFQILEWMALRFGYTFNTISSNVDINDYEENRVSAILTLAPAQPFRLAD